MLEAAIETGFDPRRLSAIPREFFDRDPREVARELLGKVLVRWEAKPGRWRVNNVLAGRIVETEAYLGVDDPAAHAAAGKTERNAVLFGAPGFAYVYFIYGNHYCLNVSCLREGVGGGVLFRAIEPLAGVEKMALLRDVDITNRKHVRLLTSGPGRMAEALGITRERDNGKDFLDSKSDLQLLDDGFRPEQIAATPRIGVTKAAEHLFRYVVAGNAFVSGNRFSRDGKAAS